MRPLSAVTVLVAFVFASAATAAMAAEPVSRLWGQAGEAWSAEGRLPDFSYAGYHRGDALLPQVPVRANARDFGAIGDGVADDTHAIQAALDATKDGAVFLPAGRYKITDYLRITKSGLVLRGAGPDQTVLWFPRGLDEVHPRPMFESRGLPTSGYSFDGAFVSIVGDYRAQPVARIVTTARRGARDLVVDTTKAVKTGDWVLVRLREEAGQSLKQYLYDGDAGDISHGKALDTKMLVRVTAVEGTHVRIDRPLRFETRAAWRPELLRFNPTVTESGIEDIGFAFPNSKYRGHFKENGANAIELRHVAHCWVRQVHIHNADMGINIVACQNTVDGVRVTADPARETKESRVPDCTGHHVFQCKQAEDNLITHFDIQTCFAHDLSVEHASGNVYADGRGRDLALDHHKDTPYENLYTAIDCGRATRVWLSGGGAGLGRECATRGTFWNLRGDRPIAPPPAGWGPVSMNFVGIQSTAPNRVAPADGWWESGTVAPANLYLAQLARRHNVAP